MGERAKVIVNEYTARELVKRDDFNVDKFYCSDLRTFVEVLRTENKMLNNNMNNAIELLKSLKVFWNKYTHDNSIEIGQIENVINVIRGNEK